MPNTAVFPTMYVSVISTDRLKLQLAEDTKRQESLKFDENALREEQDELEIRIADIRLELESRNHNND